MTDDYRIALVGCGAASAACHVPALSRTPGVRLTALVDPDATRSAATLSDFATAGGDPSGVRVATSVDGSVLDVADGAVIAAPHVLHRPIAEDLITRGIDVLMEKPLATTLADARGLAQQAANSSATVAMAHPRRLFPANAWVRSLIEHGSLGKPLEVRWDEGHPYAHEPVSWSMFDRRLSGGGVLIDSGSHVLDVLAFWFGTSLRLRHYADDSLGGVEADAALDLEAAGVDLRVALSRLRPLGMSATVRGDEATVTVGVDYPAGRCTLVTAEGQVQHDGDVDPAPGSPEGGWVDIFVEQLRNFAAAARGREPLHSDLEDGLRGVEVIESCYASPGVSQLSHPWL